jgi:Flp pilus assembly protein TadB
LGPLERLLIRVVLSLLFAVLISRFFFPNGGVPAVLGLAGVLLGLAYCFESLRKRNERENYGK